MSQAKFSDVFRQRIVDLEARAAKVALNFTQICREANISRATPDRWRRETPKTVALVDAMEAVVAAHEKARGK